MSVRWGQWALALLAALVLEVAVIWALAGLGPDALMAGAGAEIGPQPMTTTHIRLGGTAATPLSAGDMGQTSTAPPQTPTTAVDPPTTQHETPTETPDTPPKELSKAVVSHQSVLPEQVRREAVIEQSDEVAVTVTVEHVESPLSQQRGAEPAKAPKPVRETGEMRKALPAPEVLARSDDSAQTPTEAPAAASTPAPLQAQASASSSAGAVQGAASVAAVDAPATVTGAVSQADQLAHDQQQLARQQDAYRAALVARLQAHRRYPRVAQRRGLEGQVDVQFELAASGQVRSRRVVQSSGYPVLDQAGLATIDRASPLPAVPPALGAGPYVFTVPLRFNLR